MLFFNSTSTAGSATITNSFGNGVVFSNSATADNATLTNDGALSFSNSSNAGSATITNTGLLSFLDDTTADHATITNNYNTVFSTNGTAGHATIANNASLYFYGNSTAGNANITNSTTGTVYFNGNSTAGNATIANNAYLYFNGSSTAGSATITNSVTGTVNFNDSSSAGSASITNNNTINFNGTSTAGNATIGNNNRLNFNGTSTGGSATITNNSGGATYFNSNATAGNASINNYGTLKFIDTSTAGNATIVNVADLDFNSNSSAGSATLINTGAAGTTTFHDNSTAGSATFLNNYAVWFQGSSTAGNATITNYYFLSFQGSSTAGNARLTNNATIAVIDFSGSTGPNGDNKLSAGSIAGNGNFRLGANELTVGSNNLSTEVTGVIVDGGAGGGTGASLVKVGTGTLTLSGNNTYTGGTTIAGGAISVSSDANLGGAAGPLTFVGGTLQTTAGFSSARNIALGTGGGTLQVDTGTLELSGTIADSGGAPGGLTKTGAGTLSLTGNSSYSGGTTINAGTLSISTDSNLGAVSGGLTFNGGTLQYVHSGLNSLSATRAITLNSGGGTFDVTIGGTFNALSIFSPIGGSGSLTKTGMGELNLGGANSYGGATFVTQGILSVSGGNAIPDGSAVTVAAGASFGLGGNETIGSLAGAGAVTDVTAGSNLTLTTGADNTSTTFSGVISNGAAFTSIVGLTKTGNGTFTLSGNNTYTGATTVNAGTLSVNGSIASSSLTTVNAGGTLGGTGIVGNTLIDGGTLAPRNSIGTLTVQGNLVFTSAARYMVEVSPANADRVNVTGTANLGGATVNASFAAGSYVAKRYTILNAAGGLGGSTFGSFANTNLPDTFKSSLSYDSNKAYLDLELSFVRPAASAGGNQQGVGNALVNYFNRNGGIPLVYGGLTQAGLTQASGETATGGQQTTFNAMTQFMGAMTDTFAAGRGGGTPGAMGFADDSNARSQTARDAYAMFTKAPLAQGYDPRWSVWASGFGGSQTTDGSAAAGSNTSTSRIYGVAAGADYRLSSDTVAGFAMAGGGTNFSVTGGGSGRSDLFQIGGFVRHAIGATYLSGALAYGWQDVTTNRTVIADQLQARFNANTFSGRFEAGHRVATSWLGGLGLTPYAAAQVTAIALPAYAETVLSGSNAFALSYAGKTVTDTRSELGLRSDKSFALDGAMLTLRGRAAWAHDFNTDRAASATFLALPGASFVVNGAAPARDAALTTASAEVSFLNGISLAATFEGEFSQVTRSYAGKGVVRYAW